MPLKSQDVDNLPQLRHFLIDPALPRFIVEKAYHNRHGLSRLNCLLASEFRSFLRFLST